MTGIRTKLALALAALTLTACASSRPTAGEATYIGMSETRSAVSDAIGLPRDRPGPVMIDPGDDTVPTPYGGEGSRRVCSTTARDIARLTAVLGPDRMYVPEEHENETEDERDWRERAQMWTERGGGALASGARDLYHSTIVGLNPARPVIRFVGRAGEIEREARDRREMADSRRAYLRGLFDGFGCEERYLTRAFEEYGLNTTTAQ